MVFNIYSGSLSLLALLGMMTLAGCGAATSPTPPPAVAAPTATNGVAASVTAVPTAPDTGAPAGATSPTQLPAATGTATTRAPATPVAQVTVAAPTVTVPPTVVSPTLLTPLPTELPLTPEQNPAGDIPDSQVFVSYTAPDGSYQVDVPEGWARTTTGNTVTFVSKLDGVEMTLAPAATAPTRASVEATQVPVSQRTGRAVQISSVQDVTLPGGPAVLLAYTSNSDPNPVTGKQVRQDNAAYLFFRQGQTVTLHLWAPAGADNVDQWNHMAQSFLWR